MTFYADLHVHSKYSRATSRDCDLENLAYWARRKGIEVIGTGDFTHPAWRRELRDKLVPAEPGLFRLRDDVQRRVDRRLPSACRGDTRFLLSVEISTIKKRDDKTRKVHHLIYAPDFACVDAMVARISKVAKPNALPSDGRPILGLDPRDLLEIVLESGLESGVASGHGAGSSSPCYLVPAHAWTPHFAVLGSRSGFDRVTDCYLDLADHIFALETGLSSDPEMNWRVSQLDRYTLMSNSDAHSPAKLGREANAFSCARDYFAMRTALQTRRGFEGTVEFFPEEGKYHLDGHRKCGVVFEPDTTREHDGVCPVCHTPLTIGVMHRVLELADRPAGFRPKGASPFHSLVPLPEIIAEIAGTGVGSKAVARDYDFTLARLGAELDVLEHVPVEDIARQTSTLLAEAVSRLRAGQVIRTPGFDGEYGVIRMFEEGELARKQGKQGAGKARAARSRPTQQPQQEPAATARVHGAARGRKARQQHGPPHGADGGDDVDAPGQHGQQESSRCEGLDRLEGVERLAEDHLAALDPDQRQAASITEGALLIVAGPGTGKTHTLTRRIAHLVTSQGADPGSCLAITFTNRAAEEMRERLRRIITPEATGATPEATGAADGSHEIPVMTFHGLALTILRENRQACGLHRGFRIAGESERAAILASALDVPLSRARRLLGTISQIKRTNSRPDPDTEPGRALIAYGEALDRAALVDFDDLLLLAVKLLEEDTVVRASYRARYRWISIDEYQDIDELQYRLIGLLCPTGGNLCAIGDPDQAIYGFRGADVAFFLRFQNDHPDARIVHLTRNYRSTRTIVEASLQAVAPSSLVANRSLLAVGTGAEGTRRIDVVTATSDRAEAELVVHTIEMLLGGLSFFSLVNGRVGHAESARVEHDFSDFAVLYRTEAQTTPLVEAFARAGIPYQKRSHEKLTERPGVVALAEAVVRLAASDDRGIAGKRSTVADLLLSAAALLRAEAGQKPGPAGEDRGPADHDRGVHGDPGDPTDTNGAAHMVETIDAAVELLVPLGQRAGHDVERFLADLACDAEVDTWDPRADRVSLLTLHAAKGLEFRVVFLVGCEDGILPLDFGDAPRLVSPGQPGLPKSKCVWAEERRLFFVGMTRARERLYLTRAKRRIWRGAARELEPSPFLGDIDEAYLHAREAQASRKKPARPQQLGLF